MIGDMVSFEVQIFSAETWKNAVSRFEGYSSLQTCEYAESKSTSSPWIVERGLFTKNDNTIGAAQVMIRPLPFVGGGLVWLNRGPLWNAAKASFADIVAALKQTYVDRRSFYLRVAPSLAELQRSIICQGRR